MQTYSIGELVKRTGINASTIRYYERIGLLPPANRVSGKRRYDESIFPKIGIIQLAKSAGLSISEIQTLLHDFPGDTPPSERWTSMVPGKIAELRQRIVQIRQMMDILEQTLNCDCPTLEACGAENIA